VRRQDWEIVILDISMPGKSGLDILDDVRRLRPKLPVLFLSMHPEEQYARRALKIRAAGYLTKDSIPEELKEAVSANTHRRPVRQRDSGREAGIRLEERSRHAAHELLSAREFQVLRMMASGKSVKEIANDIALSVKTVSTYRARILPKTGMKTTAELIRYALQTQLVG